MLKQIFLHYVSLSGPAASIALSLGLFATVVGFVMLFARPSKKQIATLCAVSLLPLFIGIGGTVLWNSQARDTLALEKKMGIEPSATKYYDLEYGFSEFLLRFFPLIVGATSTIPPVLLVIVLKRRTSSEIWKNRQRVRLDYSINKFSSFLKYFLL